ncbi:MULTISPECIES: arabinose transporter [Pelosinus]|jgi:MFS family permease|uniref:Major facilitator superfamily MFS_1 n=1 Tax=Pelosinus fermentans B4 TaxID=1149862 RepID=I8RA14_9FIRM|nr:MULTISPECIES: arabinose transporter [Pelosinus]EIW15688.1 major facilitator superfamily MFS_1 [Pelosinus fermentans B4]EIW26622.1 major facilitator superfamily MFS_1 [Pelosinus fermentans A11]OAM92433.1 major facilitator superfamily MFS_1 [Pelosinus fermentans DSM 17108]SDQ44699.1 Predicted arabinose efflux permease, MFS family [Pelosinus fermentans]
MSKISLKQSLSKLGIAIFLTYLSVAMALPVVSVFVKEVLNLPNWLGGVAVGVSFVATILSRKYAGDFADTKSSKKCFMIGFFFYMVAALVCMAASITGLSASVSFTILIVGRLLLGIGESMTTVGIPSWHFLYLGPVHSGKILAVLGMAMYGAFALGGPVGLTLYRYFGFDSVMLASSIVPIIGVIMFVTSPEVAPHKALEAKKSFFKLLRSIWKQGMTVTLQGIGFAVLGAFISLYFKDQGWPYAGIGLSLFGIGFVISRILFGTLPDKIGGVKVALVSLVVETVGQGLLWLAPHYSLALLGALLTGLGCSMIYPAMGVEVIKRISPEQRGAAFGGFAMFQDVAYAFSAPIGGVIADKFSYSSTFLFGFIAAVGGIIIVRSMMIKNLPINNTDSTL